MNHWGELLEDAVAALVRVAAALERIADSYEHVVERYDVASTKLRESASVPRSDTDDSEASA